MSKPKKPANPPVPVDPPPPEAGQAPPSSGVVSVSATKIEAFVGPLPHPDLLEKYEQIHPGAAGIVFKSFQDLTAHQIDMEKQALTSDTSRSLLGVLAGFIISMALIIGGVFCICLGHDWAGASIIVSCVVGLAGVFVGGKVLAKSSTPPPAARQ